MRKTFLFVAIILYGTAAAGQFNEKIWLNDTFNIPNQSKTVIVKNAGFLQLCNALLDEGYKISKKDNDLQTVTSGTGDYNEFFDIRVKDSVATIKCMILERSFNVYLEAKYERKKNGQPKRNVYTYAFIQAVKVSKRISDQVYFE